MIPALVSAFTAAMLLASPVPLLAQEMIVSAAISMKEAMEGIGRQFQGAHPGVVLRYNFGGSGELQRQIEAGAPADVFISASEAQMEALARQGLILVASRSNFARNIVTVLVPLDSRPDLRRAADLRRPEVRRIALGNPKTVPAGQYAEQSLRSLGLWETVRPKVVYAENVRQVVEYVARGEVDAGFAYVTDLAVRRDAVREAFRPPEDSHQPITYPAAVVAASRAPRLAEAFVAFLSSPAAQAILSRLGFLPPGARP